MKGHFFASEIIQKDYIRGVVGKNLSASDALALGQTLGTMIKKAGGRIVCVGHDGRHSSLELSEELARGFLWSGLFVIQLDVQTTPLVNFVTSMLNVYAGVSVTGGSDTSVYNGFKITLTNSPFFDKNITHLAEFARKGIIEYSSHNTGVIKLEPQQAYIEHLLKLYDIKSSRNNPLVIAWDCGGGSVGQILHKLAPLLPGEHLLIDDKLNPNLSERNPDVNADDNLKTLSETINNENCNLAFAFSPDADTFVLLDHNARIIHADGVAAIIANDLFNLPSSTTQYCVCSLDSSFTLLDNLQKLNVPYHFSSKNPSSLRATAQQHNVLLAVSAQGHLILRQLDEKLFINDPLRSALYIISIITQNNTSLSSLFDNIATYTLSKHMKINIPPGVANNFNSILQNFLSQQQMYHFSVDNEVRLYTQNNWLYISLENDLANDNHYIDVKMEARNQASFDSITSTLKNLLSSLNIK